MKYSLIAVVLIAIMLTACKGEGTPGQYPPSLFKIFKILKRVDSEATATS